MSSSQTEVFAHHLESARQALQEAEAVHAQATANAEALRARLDATQAKRQAITQSRLSGQAKPEDAAEFAALGADADALSVMLEKAESEAEALAPDQARAALANAEAAWQRHQANEVVAAVRERAQVLEARLIQALGDLAKLAIDGGHQNFRDVWSPSEDLQTIMRHSRPETIASVRRAA